MTVLDQALDAVARSLRGTSGLARLVRGVAAAVLVLALAAWLLRIGLLDAAVWVLVVWMLLAGVAVWGIVAARRAIAALGPWHVAEHLEQDGAWRRGALTTVLDGAVSGTSPSLHEAAAARSAADVSARGEAALAPRVEAQVRLARRALLAAVAAALVLAAARPLSGAPARLWDPRGAWDALTGAVRLDVRTPVVSRGEQAVLVLRAVGHQEATLHTRAPGEGWASTLVVLDRDGAAVFTTPPLQSDMVARLEAGGRRSVEVRVTVRLPAFLGAFTATARYPGYLNLDDESFSVVGDTLVLPEGTRLDVSGRATTPLRDVQLAGASAVPLVVTGSAFQGSFVPPSSGSWRLLATPVSGARLDGEPPVLPVRLVADSAPSVEIPVPGVDTVAPPSLLLALVVSVRDDHGLSGAAIEVRRGARGSVRRVPLTLSGGAADRALLNASLDMTALGAVAGDTLYYTAVATDNAPARHSGRSREFMVRIPTDDEQRARRSAATGETAASLDSLSVRARRTQRQTEDLARERQRSDTRTGGNDSDPMSADAARKAESAAKAQEQLTADAQRARQAVDELQRAAEREGLADSALAAQLGEIRELLDKAMSPELRQKLNELREATQALDGDRTRDALGDLAKKQAELRDAIEQARELFKRAALETELGSMAKEAKQLADEQGKLNDKLGRADSAASAAAAERKLAERTDSLAASLDRAARKVEPQQTQEGLRQAASKARNAASKMRQAAQSASNGKQQEAKTSGEAAEEQLDQLDNQIDQEREEMQRAMKEEVTRALDRALAETSRLAERQHAVAEAFRRGAVITQSRTEQGLLEESTAKVLLQVVEVASKNALVSPQISVALGAARTAMRAALEAVSSASPNLREAAEQSGEAVDALAVAAYQLLRSKDKVGGSKSGSGVEEAMQQMQQMAGKQGQLSEQAQGMLQQGQGGMQQLMQMAMQQRALAQQMERMRASGQVPGAGEMAREAKELSRAIEAGRLSPETVERQQKLFRRMLDAGRQLQGEERDESKERKSEAPKSGVLQAPSALPPGALDDGVVRLPSWESLQKLSVDDRRRVLDYFRRLTEVTSP